MHYGLLQQVFASVPEVIEGQFILTSKSIFLGSCDVLKGFLGNVEYNQVFIVDFCKLFLEDFDEDFPFLRNQAVVILWLREMHRKFKFFAIRSRANTESDQLVDKHFSLNFVFVDIEHLSLSDDKLPFLCPTILVNFLALITEQYWLCTPK